MICKLPGWSRRSQAASTTSGSCTPVVSVSNNRAVFGGAENPKSSCMVDALSTADTGHDIFVIDTNIDPFMVVFHGDNITSSQRAYDSCAAKLFRLGFYLVGHSFTYKRLCWIGIAPVGTFCIEAARGRRAA